ncbi:MAG: family 78 glycoside hydrolase catalytic domain [Bacteroidia bacterium]|nr:family 78 glycoside hydrolase catalytic domain [Bacteroidia bacterium]
MKLKLLLALTIFAATCITSVTQAGVKELRVEYATAPLGIDVKIPRFSWQMEAPEGKRGCSQTAYRLLVTNPEGSIVWDSKKIANNRTLNIQYAGASLLPATRYTWTVTVWDQDGQTGTGSSWFETGLMNPNPNLSAWDGATWIGGGDEDLVLYSPYLPVFKIRYTLQLDRDSKTTRAGFIFGGNDSRLMAKDKNIYGVESGKNGSYIRLDISIAPVTGSEDGLALLEIYRVGYHPDDQPDKPFKSFKIPESLINNDNKYQPLEIHLESVFGMVKLFIDRPGQTPAKIGTGSPDPDTSVSFSLNLNPVGQGGDYICFPMLADVGFFLDAKQKARFSDLEISNYRRPSNTLFSEDLSNPALYKGAFSEFVNRKPSGFKINSQAFEIDGGKNGSLILANPSKNSMPMLRTEFISDTKQIANARLYVSSRGIYEVYLNGQRVGNDYFNPGLTQYQKTHLYQTYDVTKSIRDGKNAIGAMLGEGWWSGNITYSGENWNYFGDRQSLLSKLVITYSDGSTRIVTTNPDIWSFYNQGPVIYGSFFQGEVYDATKEAAISGWNMPGYDDSRWKKAVQVPLEGTTFTKQTTLSGNNLAPVPGWNEQSLTGQLGEVAGIIKELTAIGVEEVRPGVFVYDIGQNMVGVPKIAIRNGITGNKITMRFAEVKYPDLPVYGKNVGMIMLENIRAALSQDMYFLKGGDEVIQPRFTFHGFRYIEITGIGQALPVESVKGCVISSVNELASSYITSNPKVNKLWENITWSMRGNFLSIPTDCPQRNERMGWSGDISVFSRTATFLYNVPQFLRRHMMAFRDDQREDGRFGDVVPLRSGFGGILWGSAGITVAWESYQQYGDKEMLAEHYEAMKKYLAFLFTRIDAKTGALNEGPLGDWLSPEGSKNDNTLLWEAYFVYDLEIMAKTADLLGNQADAEYFRKNYDERKKFFNENYVDADTRKTTKLKSLNNANSAKGVELDTQASYAIPLALGVFSAENEPFAAKHLAAAVMRRNTDDGGILRPEYSLMTGFIGTASIGKALCDHGYAEIAYRMLQQTTYPSWLYSIEQGATTIWERLNSFTAENGFGGNNSMNSFNHYSFGAIGAWMFNYSLGIQRDEIEPGFKHFFLRPVPDPAGEMTYAKGYYESMYGRIESGWRLENGLLVYTATVPANTSATLWLPASAAKGITESGRDAGTSEGVTFVKYQDGCAVFELKSGRYTFKLI